MHTLRPVRHLATLITVVCFQSALVSALLNVCRAAVPDKEVPDKQSAAPATEAARLVREALVAESRGDAQARTNLLRQALEADPNYAPAHWHSGEVRVGNDWLSIDAAATTMARSGKMEEYRRRRDQVLGTAGAQLELARWCASAELKEQERVHLTYATFLRPSQRQQHEIKSKLDLVRYRGLLMPRSQADLLEQQAKETAEAAKEWKPRLARINRALTGSSTAREAALDELRAIRDPAAIPLLEQLSVTGKPEAAKAVVSALAAMPSQTATDSLVRHAVFAKEESARTAAATALRSRSLFAYVPTLMGAFQSPVEVEFQVYYIGGQFRHRLSLYQEGPLADTSYVSTGGSETRITETVRPFSRENSLRIEQVPDQTVAIDSLRAQRELEGNVSREILNRRIADTLRIATANDLESDPREWWKWWYDYNELYQSPYKPVNERRYDTTPISAVTYRFQVCSCFVAGTPVWTSTGPMPIEKIRVGDCVLAQEPDSGEMSYKAVLATTVQPPCQMLDVDLGNEIVRVTRGHPLWVDGIGWQMAKELNAGQCLHTPRGPVRIDNVKSFGELECYNLVVADFNTYFVGNSQVLAHDAVIRQITTATVPGLIDPESAAP